MSESKLVEFVNQRGERWSGRVVERRARVRDPGVIVEGQLARVAGMTMEAIGCEAALGARCLIQAGDGDDVEAEVVGFSGEHLFLMPTGSLRGLMPRARVRPTHSVCQVAVGDELLGRVIDGAGVPLDGRGRILCDERVALQGQTINPLARQPISQPLDVGVRSMNALFTAGRGQRLGLFAGSGIGKSSLLAMMTRYHERGRHRRRPDRRTRPRGQGIRRGQPRRGRPRPIRRRRDAGGQFAADAHARRMGRNEHRRILPRPGAARAAADGLADPIRAGPARDRAGDRRTASDERLSAVGVRKTAATRGTRRHRHGRRGSITAFYTVLAEGDDQQDPVVDAARAVLDGHIVLSREIAESGIYPPIDVEQSVSRSMPRITSPAHQSAAQEFRKIYSYHQRHRDLISVGAYRQGGDAQLDRAVQLWPAIESFLGQSLRQPVGLNDSIAQLDTVIRSRPPVVAAPEVTDATEHEITP